MTFEAVVGVVTFGVAGALFFYGMLVVRRMIPSVFWRRVALLGLIALIGWLLMRVGATEVQGRVTHVADYFNLLGHRVLDLWSSTAR